MNKRTLMRALLALLLTLILVAAVAWHIIRRPYRAELHKSPLTAHSIEVWVYGELHAAPGDGGSGPGFVLLKDGTGKVLEKKPVDLVISIDPPEWSKEKVRIPHFADWPLTGP
ncbi:MAG: hypothetical protein EOP88_14730 [Verrucomicrobiaceae bacterium]|nr:MAG: hypothetical protein EOP88_14730 [Verrucomicrobiaceae bacterium]